MSWRVFRLCCATPAGVVEVDGPDDGMEVANDTSGTDWDVTDHEPATAPAPPFDGHQRTCSLISSTAAAKDVWAAMTTNLKG